MALACSSLIGLAALGWPALRIHSGKIRNEIQVQKSFLGIQNISQNFLSNAAAVRSAEWQQQAKQLWDNDSRLLSFVIRDSHNTVVYAIPAVSPYYASSALADNTTPAGLFDAPERSTSRFSSKLPGGLSIDALFITVSQDLVFRALLETLLGLLLLALVVATILLAGQRQSLDPALRTTDGTPQHAAPAQEGSGNPPQSVSQPPEANHGTATPAPAEAATATEENEAKAGRANTDGSDRKTGVDPAVEARDPGPEPEISDLSELRDAPEISDFSELRDAPESLSPEGLPGALSQATPPETEPVLDEDPASEVVPEPEAEARPDTGITLRFEAAALPPPITALPPPVADLPTPIAALPEAAADDLAIMDPLPAEQLIQAGTTVPSETAGNRKRIPIDEQEIGGPKGLYDESSGLCWESYLRDRLGSELQRAASFEQDLVLLLTCWDNIKRDSADYELFTHNVRDFFNFRDLSFAFGQDGVAVVLPNVDIDHAIRQTEELIKKLTFIIQGRTDRLEYLEIFMGLSSRSGRIVDADRMIAEALVAVKKARNERDTHIMAFRPDPEKFRSYLTNR